MYGRLNARQEKALRPLIKDRVVHDLGAGDLQLTKRLVGFGARQVIAVDVLDPRSVVVPPGVQYVQSPFLDFKGEIDVAFISWPANHSSVGLSALARRAASVIYLGKNTDGSMCGTSDLFCHLVMRKVEVYVPDRVNTLIGYSRVDDTGVERELRGEERAALSIAFGDSPWSYERAEEGPG